MNKKYRNYIEQENKYYELLTRNPKFKPQGRTKNFEKVVVGIMQGDLKNYHVCDHLSFRYFDSWKDAFEILSKEVN